MTAVGVLPACIAMLGTWQKRVQNNASFPTETANANWWRSQAQTKVPMLRLLLKCQAVLWLSSADAFAPPGVRLRALLPRASSCPLRMSLANQDVPMATVQSLLLPCRDSPRWPERVCKCLMTPVLWRRTCRASSHQARHCRTARRQKRATALLIHPERGLPSFTLRPWSAARRQPKLHLASSSAAWHRRR